MAASDIQQFQYDHDHATPPAGSDAAVADWRTTDPYGAPTMGADGRIVLAHNAAAARGGAEAAAYGFHPGKVTGGEQGLRIALQKATTARNVARVNMAYGYLPSMRGNSVYSTALGNNALAHGEIEHSAGLARDAGSAENVGNAEEGAKEASFQAANSGTTGASVNLKNKQRVLGTFLGGRAQVAAAAGGTRNAATNALEQERLGTVANVKGQSGINLGERIADLSTIRQLGEAQGQVVPQAVGQGIGDLGQLYANNLLYNQMTNGRSTGGTSGGSLPSLSGGSTKPSGGFSSNNGVM